MQEAAPCLSSHTALMPHGDATQRGHAIFFLAITLIVTVLALSALPYAAFACLIFCGAAFTVFLMTTQEITLVAISVSFLLNAGLIVILLANYWRAFRGHHTALSSMRDLNAELEKSRDTLSAEVEKRTAELNIQKERLEEALAAERELNEMQNQFVSMVSHEFRTPLTIIDATARRVSRQAGQMPDAEVEARMDKIHKAVLRLSGMVERTLDASRIATGNIAFSPEPFSLSEMLADVVDRQRDISPAHVIDLEIENVPESYHGDPRLMDQILTNLISNAAKYSQEDPRVEVSMIGNDEAITLRIRDHGVGIPATELQNVSERFFRASTSKGIPGTGIGLNLVANLVELHKGCFCIDSEEGKWTEVRVRLPMCQDSADGGCCESTGQRVAVRKLGKAAGQSA